MTRKRLLYKKETLLAAVKDVNRGKKISNVSRIYGIPKTTLFDHTHGKYVGNKNSPGPARSLTDSEETCLVNYIEYMAKRGQPLTVNLLKIFVSAIIKKSKRPTKINLNKGPSKKWCRKFFKRHPELTKRTPDKADRGRMQVTIEDVGDYFTLLDQTIKKLNLINAPHRIFNCDETGFSGQESLREKVVTKRGQHPYQETLFANLGHITVHMSINAAGKCLPLLLIFKESFPRDLDGIPSDWQIEKSPNGYMDTDIFCKWLKELFIPNCGRERPVLLIMDNLGSHISPKCIDIAKENGVELLCLPPHSTHLLQPLDVSVFGTVKNNVMTTAKKIGYATSRLPRTKFASILKYAVTLLSPRDIIESFRKAGIFPVDRSVVSEGRCKQALLSENELNECIDGESNPGENVLVKLGIVPPELADVLVPPAKKIKVSKTNKNVIKGARLLTSVNEKENPKESTRIDDVFPGPSTSGESVRARTGKKDEKGRKKVASRAKRGEACVELEKSVANNMQVQCYDDEPIPDDGICVVCMTNARMEWVGCDRCDNWHHYACLPYDVQVDVDLSLVTKKDWLCNECVYLEE